MFVTCIFIGAGKFERLIIHGSREILIFLETERIVFLAVFRYGQVKELAYGKALNVNFVFQTNSKLG